MKRILLIAFLAAMAAVAQSYDTTSAKITAAGSTCTAANCVLERLPSAATTVAIQLSGTFTATVQFEVSIDGQTWSSIAANTSGDTSATATGNWTFNVTGWPFFRVRGSAFTSGPVSVAMSWTIAGGNGPQGPQGPTGPAGPAGSPYVGVSEDGSSGMTVTGGITAAKVNGTVVYGKGGNTTLAATITAAGNNGTVLIPAGSAITVASTVTISQTGLKLRCEAGATLTKGGNVTMLSVTGSGVSVEGCTFVGANGSFTGKGLTIGSAAAHVMVAHNTFQNMDTSSIYMSGGVSDVNIYDNHISPWNSSGAINLDGAGTDVNIHDNWCDGSNEASFHKCVQAHGTSAGNTINKLSVVNNHILNGEGYCVEVGKFGGDAVKNVVIADNTCDQATLVANGGKGAFGGYGGYSIDSAVDVVISNNTYRNETATTTDNPGLELIGTQYNATGNVIYGSYATLNRCIRCSLFGNTITQTFTDNPALLVEIQPGSSTQPKTSIDNNISGNTFILANGGTDAVWQFCNSGVLGDGTSFCTDNVYTDNVVKDVAGTATGAAFRISGVKGTLNSTYISQNKIINFAAGKCYNLSTNATGVVIYDNREGCSDIGSTVASNPATYRGPKSTWNIGDAINIKGGSIAFAAVATPTAPTLAASATGGTLNAATTYAYQVAAINATGTTVASTEATVTTAAGANTATVYVWWPKVVGASGYKVYGRTSGTELLMTSTALAYDVNSWTDDGSVTPSGALPASNTTLGSISGVPT
jgi:hypothetical protein